MARPSPGTPTRRTGVVPGARPRDYRPVGGRASPGIDWVAVIALLVIGAVAVAWLLSARDDGRPAGAAGTSPPLATSVAGSRASAPAASSTLAPASPSGSTAAPSLEPLITDQPSPEPDLTDEPSLEPAPTDEPSPEPVPTERSSPPPGAATVFTVDSIADGETVQGSSVEISGAAPPGATVTRDVPLWFDEHVTARPTGRWVMRLALSPGVNEFRLRLGDDRSTEIVLRIRSIP